MKLSIYPTLVECFGIIFIGYVAGKFNFITNTQSKGISLFISQIALPALIFKAMVQVNFSIIDWYFWTALLISKTVIFCMVAVLTYLFQKRNAVGKAGIFGLFVTQSNDFAFGLPILTAVFNTPENEYLVNYLYLVAPINLAILNPLAFFLLEYQRAKNDSRLSTETLSDSNNINKGKGIKKILSHTIKGIVTNPLIFMIVFGISGNFLFKQKIPNILTNLFGSLSKAFSACALFYLGLCLRGTSGKSKRSAWILPTVLVAVKGILMPILMRQMVPAFVFDPDHIHSNNSILANQTLTYTEEVSTFAFIYGSIPTAPTVIIFASKYDVAADVIATGLLRGTVLSLPVIFCSMKILQVKRISDFAEFAKLIGKVSTDVSIVSALCCVWVIIVFVLLRLYKNILHRFTFGLIFFQDTPKTSQTKRKESYQNINRPASSFTTIACSSLNFLIEQYWRLQIRVSSERINHQLNYCKFLLGVMGALFGVYSKSNDITVLKISMWFLLFAFCGCFTMTTFVSIIMMLNAWGRKRLVDRWHRWALGAGLVISSFIATLLLVTTSENQLRLETNSAYFLQFECIKSHKSFGVVFIIMSLSSLLAIIAAIFKLKWPSSNNEQLLLLAQSGRSEELCDNVQPQTYPVYNHQSRNLEGGNECLNIETESLDSESCMVNRTDVINLSAEAWSIENVVQMEDLDVFSVDVTNVEHTTSHVILLLFLAFSILLNLIQKLWHLLADERFTQGIYLELEMLASMLLHGQGFFAFVVFGFMKEVFMLPVFERIYYICTACMCKKMITLKDRSELDSNVLKLCEKFTKNHLRRCAKDILSNIKIRSKLYENTFTGPSLVNWLIESGLVSDRTEAVHFGNHLLQGRVIEHYSQRHRFYDLPYLYRFKGNIISAEERVIPESQ